jgi:hypothetical protein
MYTQAYSDRLIRLLRLDTTVFQEMRDDPNALIPAIVIAFVSFFLYGLGGWLWWVISDFPEKGKFFLESAFLGAIVATILWLVWIGVAYAVLTNVFHIQADLRRMVQACGLATVPFALGLLMFIPGINLGVGVAVLALAFLLMDIGITVSVDADPGPVIAATFAGLVVFCLICSVLTLKDNGYAPGVFLFRTPATALAEARSLAANFSRPSNVDINKLINNALRNAR